MVAGQLAVSCRETHLEHCRCVWIPRHFVSGEDEVYLPSRDKVKNRHTCTFARVGNKCGACFYVRELIKSALVCVSIVGRFIFSGALVPKQIKRLLKMRGLSAVVARDAESVQTMDEALDVVRAPIVV